MSSAARTEQVVREASLEAARLAKGLFPHQVEGLAFLVGRRRAILADDMGLGKTRQAIVAMSHVEPDGPYLVVCPASVKLNWEREIRLVHPDAEVAIVGPSAPPIKRFTGWLIVNYDLLGTHGQAIGWLRPRGLIFDEAHYLKNERSRRSRLSRELVAAAPKEAPVYLLTGTPLTSRPRDLFPLLQLAGHSLGRSFLSFAKRYCDAHRTNYGWVTDGASNLEELTLALKGTLLRRRKEDVLDLPAKLRTELRVAVPPETVTKQTRRVLDLLLTARRAQRSGRRRRAAGGGIWSDRGRLIAEIRTLRRKLAVAKVKSTIDLVGGCLEQGEKVLVFSCFTEPAERLAKHFGDSALLLTGATPAKQRQALVDRFQEDESVRVLVANLIAGGVGLNLTRARQVVFNDLDWVPANHQQAEDRCHRIGQTGTVNVSYLLAQNTIDEFVHTVLLTKAAISRAVIDGEALSGDSPDVLAALEHAMDLLSPKLADRSLAELDSDELTGLIDELRTEVLGREPGGGGGAGVAQAVASAGADGGVDAAQPGVAQPDADGGVDAAQPGVVQPDAAQPDAGHTDAAQPNAGPNAETLSRALALLESTLARPATRRFLAESSSGGFNRYLLVVEGTDLTCSCKGFEYRGRCRHATELRQGLDKNDRAPRGMEEVKAKRKRKK